MRATIHLATLGQTLLLAVAAATVLGAEAPGLPPVIPSSTPVLGPKIHFEAPVHDFGKVQAGEAVKHEFVFTNTGDAPLEISNVRASCGCTTAKTWEPRIEPGESGSIPVEFRSDNFSGAIRKQVYVTSNDPAQATAVLEIKGEVWKAVEVTPRSVYFSVSGDLETSEVKTLRIVNNLDEPLALKPPVVTNRVFQTELVEVKPGKEFELRVTAVPPFAGRYVQAPITIDTSNAAVPEIKVNAVVMVRDPLMVSPSHILLPEGPLAKPLVSTVTIRNNRAEPLEVAEAKANVPHVKVDVREVQPGRLYTITLNFPAGFEIQPRQQVQIDVRSNDGTVPPIKVPVIQRRSVAKTTNVPPAPPVPALPSLPPPPTPNGEGGH